jgi:hypothetical protein
VAIKDFHKFSAYPRVILQRIWLIFCNTDVLLT